MKYKMKPNLNKIILVILLYKMKTRDLTRDSLVFSFDHKIYRMIFFGFAFILYFIKLSVGNGL